MGLLDGKRILVTGVLTDASLAFGVAEMALAEGAEIVLTGAGRALRLTERTARKLDGDVEVLELDVTQPAHVTAVRDHLAQRWGTVDGALHAIGFMPEVGLGEDFMAAQWADIAVGFDISAYSLKTIADVVAPLMPDGGSIVGLDFDATVAWPAYNWMGVAKAALESASRYLARALGPQDIRVNLVAAGPIRTMAAKSIPGFGEFEDAWDGRAPLGLGRQRLVGGRQGLHRVAVGLVPRHHRRDGPRRRRLPRHRRLNRRSRGGGGTPERSVRCRLPPVGGTRVTPRRRSVSSRMSPTIDSSTSSRVIIPTRPTTGSRTAATWICARRIAKSTSRSARSGDTTSIRRIIVRSTGASSSRGSSMVSRSLACTNPTIVSSATSGIRECPLDADSAASVATEARAVGGHGLIPRDHHRRRVAGPEVERPCAAADAGRRRSDPRRARPRPAPPARARCGRCRARRPGGCRRVAGSATRDR